MKILKKLLCALTALSLVAAFAACSDDEGKKSDEVKDSAVSSEADVDVGDFEAGSGAEDEVAESNASSEADAEYFVETPETTTTSESTTVPENKDTTTAPTTPEIPITSETPTTSQSSDSGGKYSDAEIYTNDSGNLAAKTDSGVEVELTTENFSDLMTEYQNLDGADPEREAELLDQIQMFLDNMDELGAAE